MMSFHFWVVTLFRFVFHCTVGLYKCLSESRMSLRLGSRRCRRQFSLKAGLSAGRAWLNTL